jgi:hypothetical protein
MKNKLLLDNSMRMGCIAILVAALAVAAKADVEMSFAAWLRATLLHADRFAFQQELDPLVGEPIGGSPNYTPSLLLYLATCRRLLRGTRS